MAKYNPGNRHEEKPEDKQMQDNIVGSICRVLAAKKENPPTKENKVIRV